MRLLAALLFITTFERLLIVYSIRLIVAPKSPLSASIRFREASITPRKSCAFLIVNISPSESLLMLAAPGESIKFVKR